MSPLRLRPAAALAALVAAALATAGCGISDPYNDPQAAATATTAPPAPSVTIERPGMAPWSPGDPKPEPQKIDVEALSADAAETIRVYADLTGTWTWSNVAARHRRAGALAIDGARTTAAMVAGQISVDPRYRSEQMRQTTTLEAVIARGGARDSPRYLVVQRRRTELRSLPATEAWVVTLVRLRRVSGRWAVSSWEDQA